MSIIRIDEVDYELDLLTEEAKAQLISVQHTDQKIAEGVTLIQSPGHTWGTCSLKVDLPETGTMIFTSDAVYMTSSFGPPAFGSSVVYDSIAWLQSVENLRRIQQETNAMMIFGHDAQQMKTLRFGPDNFYA